MLIRASIFYINWSSSRPNNCYITRDGELLKKPSYKKGENMKTEFLKNLGLTDEQVNSVMEENGKDIAREQNSKATVEKELNDTKTLLANANKQIEDFKGMDIEAIKKSADEYKTKYEEADKKSKDDIAELKKSHAIDLALINTHHAKNIKSVKANLNLENVKLDGDKLIGFDDQIEALKKSDAYLFDIEKNVDEGNDGNSDGKKETVPPNKDKETKADQMLKAMGLK